MDATHPPETLHSILDADGTQTACIIVRNKAKVSSWMAPQGQGKVRQSLISSLNSWLIKIGSLCIEKAVALEVVKSKLDTVGSGEFVLEP